MQDIETQSQVDTHYRYEYRYTLHRACCLFSDAGKGAMRVLPADVRKPTETCVRARHSKSTPRAHGQSVRLSGVQFRDRCQHHRHDPRDCQDHGKIVRITLLSSWCEQMPAAETIHRSSDRRGTIDTSALVLASPVCMKLDVQKLGWQCQS
jgi:hypothetical protein